MRKIQRRASEGQKQLLSQYQQDPERYAQEVLRVSWWSKQTEIARSVVHNKRTAVQAAYGVGKTFTVAGLVNWYFDVYDDSLIVTTAPTFPQVKTILWPQIRDQRTTDPPSLFTSITDPHNPKHLAIGRAAKDPDAFQGYHAERLLVVFDEAAGVRQEIWDTGERLIVGADNRFVAIGNPTEVGSAFHRMCNDPSVLAIRISALEHPNVLAALEGKPEPFPGAVSLERIERWLEDPYWTRHLGTPESDEELRQWKSSRAFEWPPGSDIWYEPMPPAEVSILGLFPSQTERGVWSMAWLEAARDRADVKWQAGDPLECGIDVARYGDDSSALHVRRGAVSLFHSSWRKMSTTETVGKIYRAVLQMAEEAEPPEVIVRVGMSGGDIAAAVYDQLEEVFAKHERIAVYALYEGGNPIDKQHKNKRSELWMNAASYGREGELNLSLLDDRAYESLFSQLTAPTWSLDSRGRLLVEPKDKTKERIKRSPDDADAFNCAYASEGAVDIGNWTDADLQQRSKWIKASPEQQESVPAWGTAQKSRWKGRFGR